MLSFRQAVESRAKQIIARFRAPGITCGACGSGKTVIFSDLVARAIRTGKGVVVVDGKGDCLKEIARAVRLAGRGCFLIDCARPLSQKDSELVEGLLAEFEFVSAQYEQLFRCHLHKLLGLLAELDIQRSIENLIRYADPEEVTNLSYLLPRARGVGVRTYLSDLPAGSWEFLVSACGHMRRRSSQLRACAGGTPA